jgi:hypothetical protein
MSIYSCICPTCGDTLTNVNALGAHTCPTVVRLSKHYGLWRYTSHGIERIDAQRIHLLLATSTTLPFAELAARIKAIVPAAEVRQA